MVDGIRGGPVDINGSVTIEDTVDVRGSVDEYNTVDVKVKDY